MLLFDSLLVCNANDASSAPMKALASEIVRKLGKRLKWLAIQVRELTGDFIPELSVCKDESDLVY